VEVPRVGGVPVKVLFMGSPKFAIPILEGLLAHHRVVGVVTQPDRPAGRGLKLKPPPVKELALAHGIPVFQPESLKREEAIAWIRAKEPDVIVVAAFRPNPSPSSPPSPPTRMPQRSCFPPPSLQGSSPHPGCYPQWRPGDRNHYNPHGRGLGHRPNRSPQSHPNLP
jgi:methionyl-tRNA formyltransferase